MPLPEVVDDGAHRSRFLAEAEQLRRLSGDAVWSSPVVEISEEASPTPWFASPYKPVLSLPESLAAHGSPLPERTVRAIGAMLAEACAGLHSAGFAHAGISPTSVFLSDAGLRLSGFGAVRAAAPDGEDRSSAPGLIAACLAPEQLAGGRPRPLGDIYALGTVLSYAATGDLVPERSELPEGLRDTVGRCLRRDPAHRPAASALLEELMEGFRGPAQAPTGAISTRVEAGQPAGPTGHGAASTMLDGGSGRAAGVLMSGWLPSRVIAGVARRAALTLAAEAEALPVGQGDSVQAGDALRTTGAVGGGPHSLATAGASEGSTQTKASPVSTATGLVQGAVRLPSRRSLVIGTSSGVAGAAVGFAGVAGASVLGGTAKGGRTPRDPGRALPPPPLWHYRLSGDAPRVAPYVWRDKVAVVASSSECVGVSMGKGRKLWSADGIVPQGAPVGAGDDLVMIPDVAAPSFVSPASGQVRWREQQYDSGTKGDLQSVLGAGEGVIWFTVDDGGSFLVAYDVEERRERWRTPLPKGFALGDPDVANSPSGQFRQKSTLVLSEAGGSGPGKGEGADGVRRLVAVARTDGRELWTRKIEGVASGAVLAGLADGKVLVADKRRLRAVDPADGGELWTVKAESSDAPFGVPAFSGRRVYVADAASAVHAVDARSGKLLWRRDPELLSGPVLGKSVPALVSPSGRTVLAVNPVEIVAFNAADGRVLWRFSGVSGSEDAGFGGPERQIAFGEKSMVVVDNKSVYALPVD